MRRTGPCPQTASGVQQIPGQKWGVNEGITVVDSNVNQIILVIYRRFIAINTDTAFSTVSVMEPAPGGPATHKALIRPSVSVMPSGGYTQPEFSSVSHR